MNALAGYLKDYFKEIEPKTFLVTSIFLSLLIWLNYTVGIEKRMKEISPWLLSLLSFYIFYLFVFGFTWMFQPINKKSGSNSLQKIMPLFVVAPLLFSLKVIHWQIPSFITSSFEYPWNRYFAIVIELPLKLAMLLIALFFIHKFLCKDPYFFGLSPGNIKLQPYLLVLLFMIPFISIASVQGDFLNVYPKVRVVEFMDSFSRTSLLWKLIYEISYGLDFISIELFFRGFLVLCLVRFAGIHAILPMAAFYCTVHFGKPLAECISSFFGALALGVIAYRTRSIVGGLIIHLGVAYMMEIGGYLGNLYFNNR